MHIVHFYKKKWLLHNDYGAALILCNDKLAVMGYDGASLLSSDEVAMIGGTSVAQVWTDRWQ